MRPATLLEIARRNDYPLPADDEEGLAELYDFRDFAHFIEVWILTTNALQTAEDFRQVVVDYAAEAASHGAVYLEGIFSPSERVRRGVDWDEIFSGYCDGAQEARELHGVEVRLTPDIVRGFPLDEAEQVVRYSAAYRERGVVGVGLGGLEAEFPPEPFEPAFALARELGLASVPHAGEVAGPPSVRGALEELGADRLRHGIRAVEDPGLLREIADRRIVLDVCPISNLRTRVVGSLEEHPLPQLLAAGARCSISTDDPAMFGTDLGPRLRGGRRARARPARRLRGRARGRALRRGDEGAPARGRRCPRVAGTLGRLMARGAASAQRKQRPKPDPKRSKSAPALGGTALLLAPAPPREDRLRPAGARVRVQLRPARRRLRLERDQRRAAELLRPEQRDLDRLADQRQAGGGRAVAARTSTSTSTSPASTRATTRRRRRSPRCARRGRWRRRTST